MDPISSIPLTGPANLAGMNPAQAGGSTESSFKDFLLNSIQEVNAMQQEADLAVENMVTGGDATPGEVLTAVQKADIAFRLMMQMRNKIVQAYQEVQNIRV